MIKQALQPIRRRIRLLRLTQGLCWGLLAGAALCLALAVLSFFTPMEGLWRYLLSAALACPLLGGLGCTLYPVSLAKAAARADACGLKERAQTALAFQGDGSPMAHLQRADAQTNLAALPIRQALTIRPNRRVLACALALALVCTASFFIHNPQSDILRAREQVRQALQAQADTLEKAAETISQQGLTEAERQELRRITADMARELRQSGDTREALRAVDEAQKQMETLQEEIRQRLTAETANALSSQPSLQSLGLALESGDTAEMESALSEIADMLEDGDAAQSLSDQLAEAASESPEGSIQQGLSASASAAAASNSQAALASLAGALQSAGAAQANLNALMTMARAGVVQAGGQGQGASSGQGGSGQGQGQGQGKGQGGGAGQGTSQQDGGYTSGMSQSAQGEGSGGVTDKVGNYERIYDPTRLGGDNEASVVTGEMGEGESIQARLGPGTGDFTGTVPYTQVIGEYRQAAAQAMDRASLPASLKDWVDRYFDALID